MHKIRSYKKAIALLILSTILTLTACGYQETEKQVEDQIEAGAENTFIPENTEDETNFEQEEETLEEASEVSTDQTVVIRRGKEFLNCGLSAGGDMLYTYECISEGNGIRIAEMPEEEQQISWSYIELPDHMAVRNITTDNQGRCHILLMEMGKTMIEGREFDVPTYEVSYIWTVNREGEVESKLDVSDLFATEQRSPTCFITDLEGNFYFDNENEIIRFNPDGGAIKRWALEGYEIEALACGKSGKIYCIYEDYQGVDILELLEEDGIADLNILMPNFNCKYCHMATGPNEELLIFNRVGGAFAYAAGDTAVNQRVGEKDMPVSNEDIFIDVILDDGRLCLMTRDSETEEILYYYIPTTAGGAF